MYDARRSVKDGGGRGEMVKEIVSGQTHTGDGSYPSEI